MVKVIINGLEVFVPSGSSVLEACKEVGINIPRFCYHDRLSVAGNCRMCLVEIEKSPKPVASCAMPVIQNMKIFTDSPLVKKSRENVLEILLLNHPLDCPICDQGGECDLQDQTRLYGGDYSRCYTAKRSVSDKYCGPLIKTIMTRCIHCTRCVRFATEIAGVDILGTLNRGQETEIGTYLERVFSTEISGNVIDLCPVGALTSKPYAFSTRPWELRTVESIDFTDCLGSNIYVDYKESEIMRIIPRNNEFVNQDWISDKSRFSYDSSRSHRINEIFYKKGEKFSTLDWEGATSIIKDKILFSNILFLASSHLDFDSFAYLRNLEKRSNIRVKLLDDYVPDSSIVSLDSFLTNIDSSDFCLLLGVNARIESSILNIRLRSQWQRGGYSINCIGSPYKSNTSLNFLSLSSRYLISFLAGKCVFQRLISQSKLPIIITGSNFLKRFNFSLLKFFFKKINKNSRFFFVNSFPNTMSSHFLGFDGYNSSDLLWCDTIIGLNLEDTTKSRKIFKKNNKFKIWAHSNGNSLASLSDLILPVSVPFEFEGVFLNTECRPQRFYKVLSPLKSNRPCLSFLKAIYFIIFSKNFSSSSFRIIKFLEALSTFNSFSSYKPKFKSFFFYCIGKVRLTSLPFKSNLEDFYLSSSYLKSSNIMSRCSLSFRSGSTNFN